MFERWKQKTLQCRDCGEKIGELDIDGVNQNICPNCEAVNSCAPIEEFGELE